MSTALAFARQSAMYLAHVSFGLSYAEVGRAFGRDRTTAAYACRLIEDRRDDPAIDAVLGSLENACGALRRHPERTAEVKRMYTRPSHQGRGIGGRVLDAIEALARREGFARLVLETGHRHPAAWRVYERAGFSRCEAVLDYPYSEYSLFYAKTLAADPPPVPGQAGIAAREDTRP